MPKKRKTFELATTSYFDGSSSTIDGSGPVSATGSDILPLEDDQGLTKSTTQNARTVFIGGRYPADCEVITPQKFPNNRVVSSKYTLLNFIPKNLFEQFRRVANMYFLWVAIIQLAIDSPVSPLTTSMPLAFVVAVTAIKQGYEDWLRHQADKDVNFRKTQIVENGRMVNIQSMDIKVGDIVFVRKDESFPCDLVMLASSEKDGKCQVTTANLDGETNLKVHSAIAKTKHMKTAKLLSKLVGMIECENPNTDLYRFIGRISLYKANGERDMISVGVESVLLKGARLKNTPHVFGCAVYTGQETKMSLNSKVKANKFSTIEKSMNQFLIVFLGILLFEMFVCTGLRYLYSEHSETWYMGTPVPFSIKDLLQTALSFLVIFNYIIPISLYVTIEMQKFFGSMFFVWDEELYDAPSNQCAKCNTSDLNEELGQVQYLFTDKTGTLTENDMRFRQCSINGIRYQEFVGSLCLVPDRPRGVPKPVDFTAEIELFLLVLSICHTVHINAVDKTTVNGHVGIESMPEFHASSPDEKALVEACYRLGVVFKGVSEDNYRIIFRGDDRQYKCLQVLEFTSDRRCMSVIVKDRQGSLFLLCKGAESSVMPKCSSGPFETTMKHVNDYAMLGLRTLVIACKKLSPQEYQSFANSMADARNSLVNREEKVAVTCDLIEKNMQLLGAVGVEDRLQEGVPETLESLRVAGIKVWILTGDKMETAINISYSCGHFKRHMKQLKLTGQKSVDQCVRTLTLLRRRISDEPGPAYGLVIDGASLVYALEPVCAPMLLEVSCYCQAVVCCRMSPIQKSEVVKLIKCKGPGKPITAAIGDGANDCSMIQEAHVGLGIMGKEGRQAMRASDFAFSRFKFLQKVFLVHGHYYYIRVSTVVQYFFYKNVAFITPQVYFTFFSAFSTQTLYDGLFMSFFNIFFTSLPIFLFGLFEQDIKPETLMERPELYREISKNSRLSVRQFVKWNILGLWHSVVFFFTAYCMFGDNTIVSSGRMFGILLFGTFIFHSAVIVINLKLLLESRFLTWFFVGSVIFSIVVAFMGFTIIYSSIDWSCLFTNYQMYWVYINILASPTCWLAFCIILIACLVPDVIIAIISHHFKDLKRVGKAKSSASTRTPQDELSSDQLSSASEKSPLQTKSKVVK